MRLILFFEAISASLLCKLHSLDESEQEGDRFFTQDGLGPVAACIEIDCLAATLEFSGYVARRKTYQAPCPI